MKKVLLVNPWIYDFAAYDLWIKPWGLLKISSILKEAGCDARLLDLLDRSCTCSTGPAQLSRKDGTGKYYSEILPKPLPLKDVPRTYRRYGVPERELEGLMPEKAPDIILVTSGMTYWYPGVVDIISILRQRYPSALFILGGIYATLEHDHAVRYSGADVVLKNSELGRLPEIMDIDADLSWRNILDVKIDMSGYALPSYGVLRVSLGCPFSCGYCAQRSLGPKFMLKNMEAAFFELETLMSRGITDIAYYDDALLYDEGFIVEYLNRMVHLGKALRLYTPNGLHARFMTGKIASLMKRAGFINPILSLELSDDDKADEWHDKVTRDEFVRAVESLAGNGFGRGGFTVYLMLGLPGTSLGDVMESMEFVHSLGGRISLSEFTPVPGTSGADFFDEEIMKEPLLHNNSIYPAFSRKELSAVRKLKQKAVRMNAAL